MPILATICTGQQATVVAALGTIADDHVLPLPWTDCLVRSAA
jgi:hypothetical protein